ncbi:reductase [Streptomyces davaonensis JCM 4913]|uniref:Reductase n=1 Tax=Streptomyces davaonensis (strain DSM 101723 / JCM 4913 / KCC S-0913 / 768) TaxID=1214101 RepID=K4RE40_STRDJ|nr:NAD-dependent epimerase/dehydratase family protein [Streptomyces davaonensis]CCK31735.1 reductase [Streptomyces davaonensis JCM 4913]
MGRVVVIGATGQIGRAAVAALAGDGWEVTALSRRATRVEGWPDEVRVVAADRDDDSALAAAIGDGCDTVVDLVAYGAAHAHQLTALAGRIGSAVVISSAEVYEDDRGRGFATMGEPDGFPAYPVPIREDQPTVRADGDTYRSGKAALEHELLASAGALPTTLLRACAVHGPYSPLPRELYFVKRNLDGRRRRALAFSGESRFHPSGTRNLAELIRLAAARPGSRVLNAADPQAPTVAEIGAAVDAVMGVDPETVLLEGPPPNPAVGRTPWSAERPVVCDMTAAERELGYRPVTTYVQALPETVQWLERVLAERDWREAFPLLAKVYPDLFDYAAEDAWFER